MRCSSDHAHQYSRHVIHSVSLREPSITTTSHRSPNFIGLAGIKHTQVDSPAEAFVPSRACILAPRLAPVAVCICKSKQDPPNYAATSWGPTHAGDKHNLVVFFLSTGCLTLSHWLSCSFLISDSNSELCIAISFVLSDSCSSTAMLAQHHALSYLH